MRYVALAGASIALCGCSVLFSGDEHRGSGGQDDGGFDAGRDAGEVDCATAADGTACGDGRVCAGGSCETSFCGDSVVDARTEECDDGNDDAGDGCSDCELDCDDAADCDDGEPCNGAETCGDGHVCEAGTPLAEGTTCTGASGDGVCRAAAGELACVSAACGNGDMDPGEECDDGMNGDDADGCTDACRFTCTSDTDCVDADVCNGDEVCDVASHVCAAGTPPVCDDGVACTNDACDPLRGCTTTLDDMRCNDSVPCTDDTCTSTGCVNAPVHTRCDDGVGCTDNVCGAGGCSFPPNHGRCDDGVACTSDSCTSSGCSNALDDSRCNDGIACTEDRCSAAGCTFAPVDSRCPASGCSTSRCVSGVGCQPSSPLSNCRVVSGRQVFRVPAGGPNGNGVCAAVGLSCSPIGVGTLGGTNTACLAFRPGTPTQVSSSSGFGGGVYCSGTTSGVCAGASNLCHECTACTAIDCGTSASTALLTEFYVECR